MIWDAPGGLRVKILLFPWRGEYPFRTMSFLSSTLLHYSLLSSARVDIASRDNLLSIKRDEGESEA